MKTRTTATITAASAWKPSSRIKETKVGNDGVPNIIRDITTTTASETWGTKTMDAQIKVKPKQIPDALNLKEVVERSVGLPYHEVNYMTGSYLRDRADRLVPEACIKSKTLTDQCYTNTNKTIKITKKIVKVNKKWTQ